MPTDAEIVPLAPAAERPAVTRMWVALQKLTRMRDEFCRDKNPAGRVESARAMVERAAELQALAEEVRREAESATSIPSDPAAA